MLSLDWLKERGRILRGAIQPIEGVHFYRSRFRSRYRGLCDRVFIPLEVCTLYVMYGATANLTLYFHHTIFRILWI